MPQRKRKSEALVASAKPAQHKPSAAEVTRRQDSRNKKRKTVSFAANSTTSTSTKRVVEKAVEVEVDDDEDVEFRMDEDQGAQNAMESPYEDDQGSDMEDESGDDNDEGDDEADEEDGDEDEEDEEEDEEGDGEEDGDAPTKNGGFTKMAAAISKLLTQDMGKDHNKKPILAQRKSIERKLNNAILDSKARKALSADKKVKQDKDRVIPDYTTMDEEKRLRKIATRGVVQLFNAIRTAQKSAQEARSATTNPEEVKQVTKSTFLDMLKGQNSSSSGPTASTGLVGKATTKQPQKLQGDGPLPWMSSDYLTAPAKKHWDEKHSDDDV